MVKMDLRLDDRPAGTTVAKAFALLPVLPGHHILVSKAENTFELPIFVGGGEIVFVWQEVRMGFVYARSQLQIVSPAKGRAGVRRCELIDFPPPPIVVPSIPPAVRSPMPAPQSATARSAVPIAMLELAGL